MDPLHSGYLYIHTVNALVTVGFRSNSSQNMYILIIFFRKPKIPNLKSKPSDIDPTVTVVLTAWIHNISTLGNLDPIKQFAKYAVRFRSDSLQNTHFIFLILLKSSVLLMVTLYTFLMWCTDGNILFATFWCYSST